MRKTLVETVEDFISEYEIGANIARIDLVRKMKCESNPCSIRTAVDMTLKRKCEQKELMRIGYGIYQKLK
jgi:hypothetical protein